MVFWRTTLVVYFLVSAVSPAITFSIRKCCSENQLILEDIAGCGDFNPNLLEKTNINDTNWPWWFPSDFPLLVNSTNKVRKFPENNSSFEVIAGCGQPCGEQYGITLPSYFYAYQFFDDGSMKLFHNPNQNGDKIFPPLTFCVDRFHSNSFGSTKPEYMVHLCPCDNAVCYLKCCGPNLAVKLPTGEEDITEENCESDMDIKGWTPPVNNSFVLNRFPDCNSDEDLFVPKVGVKSSYIFHSDGSATIGTFTVPKLKYCVENVVHEGKMTNSEQLIRCYPRVTKTSFLKIRRLLYGSLSVVGAIFLALTIVIYAVLPREKTVNDKNLISQTWSLLIGYIGMSITQLALYEIPHTICVLLGFITLYAFLASFFWLNVMCVDLAWAFSEMRLIRDMMVWQNRRRFMQYSIYSWACPAIIVLAVIIVDFVPGVPESIIKPEFSSRCWFTNDSMAKLAYFYGPIAVLLAANILLFLYTAYKIFAAQNSSSSLINSNRAHEKQRFILYMKLFMLMGLSWVLELVSWAVGGPDYYWYGPDVINVLRAVFIFITLCCKKQVIQDLREKFKMAPHPKGRTTASTSVISLSGNPLDHDRRATLSSSL